MALETEIVSLRITLRYGDIDEFVERYAENVSAAGLFLRTKSPKPPGTRIRFELLLADGSKALSGEGVVVTTRRDDRPGMGLRFHRLEASTQEVVNRIVEAHGQGSFAPTPLGPTSGVREPSRPGGQPGWRPQSRGRAGWGPGTVRAPSGGSLLPRQAKRRFSDSSTASESTLRSAPRRPSSDHAATERGSLPRRRSSASRPWARDEVDTEDRTERPRFRGHLPNVQSSPDGETERIAIEHDTPPVEPEVSTSEPAALAPILTNRGDTLLDEAPLTEPSPVPEILRSDTPDLPEVDHFAAEIIETAQALAEAHESEIVEAEGPGDVDAPTDEAPGDEAEAPEEAEDTQALTGLDADEDEESERDDLEAPEEPGDTQALQAPDEGEAEGENVEAPVDTVDTPAPVALESPVPDTSDVQEEALADDASDEDGEAEAGLSDTAELPDVAQAPEAAISNTEDLVARSRQPESDDSDDGEQEDGPADEEGSDRATAGSPTPSEPPSAVHTDAPAVQTPQDGASDSLKPEDLMATGLVFVDNLDLETAGNELIAPEGAQAAPDDEDRAEVEDQAAPIQPVPEDEDRAEVEDQAAPISDGDQSDGLGAFRGWFSGDSVVDAEDDPEDYGPPDVAASPIPDEQAMLLDGEAGASDVDSADSGSHEPATEELRDTLDVPAAPDAEAPDDDGATVRAVPSVAVETVSEPEAIPPPEDPIPIAEMGGPALGSEAETEIVAPEHLTPDLPIARSTTGIRIIGFNPPDHVDGGTGDVPPSARPPPRVGPLRPIVEKREAAEALGPKHSFHEEVTMTPPAPAEAHEAREGGTKPPKDEAERPPPEPSVGVPETTEAPLVVGIDLGGQWVRMGYLADRALQLIDSTSGPYIPALVGIRADGNLVVGAKARSVMLEDAGRVISPMTVLRALKHGAIDAAYWPILRNVRAERGRVHITLGARTFDIRKLLAALLGALQETIAGALQGRAFRCAIAIPDGFDEDALRFLEEACQDAHLKVDHWVSDTDALVAGATLDDPTIDSAVTIDLGASHLSVCVLKKSRDGLAVVATAWDPELSARKLDLAMTDLTLEELAARANEDHRADPVARARLLEAVERGRNQIDASPNIELKVTLPAPGGASGVVVERTINLALGRAYQVTEKVVADICTRVQETLRQAGIHPRTLDAVILAGSGGDYPPVVQALGTLTEQEPLQGTEPTETMLLGLARTGREDEPRAGDPGKTLSVGVGIELPGGRFLPLLTTGQALPARLERQHVTTKDNQTELGLKLFQGKHDHVRTCTALGNLTLTGLPRGERGEVKVTLVMEMDTDGVLTATLTEPTTGATDQLVMPTEQTPVERRQVVAKQKTADLEEPPAPPEMKKGFFSRLFGR